MSDLLDTISLPRYELQNLLAYAFDKGIKLGRARIEGGEYLSLSDIERQYNVSRHSIRQAIDNKLIKDYKKTGNTKNCKLLVNRVELEIWLDTK